ncbi:MAG: sugar ABC transporter substrate-binding protein [Planctomycetaceae bacterium]|nr:sugar ABC transporter substrate-binding protein [Planctomycetaceae bacterium]
MSRISALLLCSLFVGCSGGSTGNSGETGTRSETVKPRIALIMKSLANEFFSTMSRGAVDHQKDSGEYELIVNGINDETDLSGQVSLVEQMMAQQVDAIVIAPADSKALVPVLKRALDEGIVVINIDNKLDADVLEQSGIQIPFVGPNNRAGAKQVGDFLATQLQSGDEVAILEGITTSFNGQQRKLGFQDAMTEAGMKIVDSQSAQWEMTVADQVTSSILTAHPQIKAILACNDSMAVGAMAAIRSAGRDDVKVVGFDNISAVKSSLANGNMTATADQHGDQLAVFGIEYALQALMDGTTELIDRETPVDLITVNAIH